MFVSVIIPCYNGEAFIGQTIGSLLEQTRQADEIIVVDDGSSDDSAGIARRFGDSVKVLSKKNEGAAIARNFGAGHAKGDALMFLDADDVLGPTALEALVAHLERHPDGVVACPWFRLDKAGNSWVRRPPSCPPLEKWQDYLGGWMTGWYHPPCSVLWSRTAYEKAGGWDPAVTVNDDGDHMMRALINGAELHITDRGSAFYRRFSGEQKTATLSGTQFTRKGRESQIYVLQKIAKILKERGMLEDYRRSLTLALIQLRLLCKEDFPDLSDRYTDLIRQYGESGPVRAFRSVGRLFRYLGRRGGKRIRRYLGKEIPEKQNGLIGTEVTYGLSTLKKTSRKGRELDIRHLDTRQNVSEVLLLRSRTL